MHPDPMGEFLKSETAEEAMLLITQSIITLSETVKDLYKEIDSLREQIEITH